MSYEILYDKCFIKANDKYIPMILTGSNNCYQYDRSSRGRRERSWLNFTYACGGKQYATEAELLAHIEAEKQKYLENYGEESLSNFGYYSSFKISGNTRTTFGQYKGIFTTGMKKALTIEQLREFDVYLQIYTYDYGTKYQDKAKKEGFEWLGSVTIASTEHFFETLKKFEDHYKDSGYSWRIGFDTWNLEKDIKTIRKKMFPEFQKKYEYVTQDHFYTVMFNHRGSSYYYVKRTRNGIKYTHYPYLQFATEKEAKKLQNRLKDKVELTIHRIDEHGRVRIPQKVENVV